MEKTKLKDHLYDGIIMATGAVIYAIAVNMLMAPNHIAPGGVTGLATIINYLTAFPIGTVAFIMNIPLFILGFKYIGGEFIVKTLISTVALSVGLDTLSFLPVYTSNRLLAAIYGGILGGIGLGLVFVRGATTGGSDLGGKLIRISAPHISMGRMMLMIDGAVVILAAAVYRDIESAFYAIIALFINSKVIDAILLGFDVSKVAFIISSKNDEIKGVIITKLNRGVTLLNGQGGYSNMPRTVLLCAVKPYEIYKLRETVAKIDPAAFMILSDATEVIGEGFKSIKKDW